ncbi:hypothetical protein [Actinoplanes sp. NPDC049316]|uniref:hypothetical protein n=1 Tax=Actinoplanes sp. NPDC049316 TaxID=3154727 RepID=UPI003439984B
MSYWGTIVVARPQGLLVDQDGVSEFGHRHRWLRDLSDGWQLLETSGFDDPPDLRGACEAVAASTGHPVLAAFVSDDWCATMVTAVPGRAGPLTHLWPVSETCGAYRHQPREMPEPAGRRLEEVTAELTGWSESAGFQPDADRLRLVIGQDTDQVGGQVLAAVYEVVKALGFVRIGRTYPWSLPAFDWPFSGVMFTLGPACQARWNAQLRSAGVRHVPPVLPWENAALALETELWASMYRPDVEVAALARRAAFSMAAYYADSEEEIPALEAAGLSFLDPCALRLLTELESRLANGTVLQRSEEEIEARRHADALATEPR